MLINVDTNLSSLLYSIAESWQRLEFGFTMKDLENFMYIVTILRFTTYSFLYNIKTGFFISCISFIAAKFWYSHLIYLLKSYAGLAKSNGLALKLWASYRSQLPAPSDNKIPLKTPSVAFSSFISKCLGNNNEGYRIDPISMLFSILPDSVRNYSDSLYYAMWDSIGPAILKIFVEYSFVSKSLFAYLLIVRFGKKRCPYLIRWHWTFILLSTVLLQVVLPVPYRLNAFAEVILLNQNRIVEYFAVKIVISSFIFLHISSTILALLHALLGQYFYVPFVTDNVEVHIGKRPKNSIYSGGYTAWQDFSPFLNADAEFYASLTKKRSGVGKLWWGWLGRGNAPQISTRRQKKRRKIFKKLKAFLKNLFK